MQHHPPLASVTLASHSLRVMRTAGIDTSRIKSHAVRKTVATAQIDLGSQELQLGAAPLRERLVLQTHFETHSFVGSCQLRTRGKSN
jgi:hypothetical protein